MRDAKALVQGVYSLAEWRREGAMLTPPRVDGRFILRDGLIVTILSDADDPGGALSVAQYGRFTLDTTHFAYGYEHAANFQVTPTGIVALPMLAAGWRIFTVRREAEQVVLATESAAFTFTPAGMAYAEDGVVLRRWQRLAGVDGGIELVSPSGFEPETL